MKNDGITCLCLINISPNHLSVLMVKRLTKDLFFQIFPKNCTTVILDIMYFPYFSGADIIGINFPPRTRTLTVTGQYYL